MYFTGMSRTALGWLSHGRVVPFQGRRRAAHPQPPASTAIPTPSLFVVSVAADQQLFGVHRADADAPYTTYVLGFRARRHAEALAAGLEAYRAAHGVFPPRDLSDIDGAVELDLTGLDLESGYSDGLLRVEDVTLPAMLQRLRGTGIVLSVLSTDGEEDGTFEFRDVRPDASAPAVAAALDRLWTAGATGADDPPAADQTLLPKPLRAVDWDEQPLAFKMLSASALKCLVLAEVMCIFWLLHTLE